MPRPRTKKASEAALEVLADHGIVTPPVYDVDDIARKLGLDVRYEPADEANVSGVLAQDANDESFRVAGLNSLHSRNRSRFALAHLIGCHVLHKKIRLHVLGTELGKDYRRNMVRHVECNAFAAELLMPAHWLLTSVGDDRHDIDLIRIEGLAKRYRVEPITMTLRLVQLGYLDPLHLIP